MADFSNYLSAAGVELEKQALDKFGAAALGSGSALRSGFLEDSEDDEPEQDVRDDSVWSGTMYAGALVKTDQVEYNPKLKFMFKISFEFDQKMIDAASQLGYDLNGIQQSVSFMIRRVDRPKFDYQYEEVNMYNFRTKVLKQINHREVSFTMFDDIGNNVLNFINLYRQLQQPITRQSVDPLLHHGDFGFEFDETLKATDTAMRGALPGDSLNILTKMTIHQIYVERGSTSKSLVKSTDFVFINPRFTNIDIDDMDHENGGNFNTVTCTTDFDTMFIAAPTVFSENSGPSLASGDIPTGAGEGSGNPIGGTRDGAVNLAMDAVSRGISPASILSTNSTASSVSSGLSLLGINAERTLGQVKSQIASVIPPFITDDSTPLNVIRDLSTRIKNDDFGFFS